MARADTGAAAFRWSTASLGLSADTSPMELSELAQHLYLCRRDSRLSQLYGVLHVVRNFVGAHRATSVMVLAFVAWALF